MWCQENNKTRTRNKNKTKELIVDFRKQQREHSPIHVNGTAVEKVESFKFLEAHITDKLKWITHTDGVVKKVQQSLYNLRRLNKCGLSPKTLTHFYRCTIESGWCGLPNALPGSNYPTSRKPTAPDVTGRRKRSTRTSTTRATACSPRYHPEGEVSTGASKLGPRD